MLIVSTGPEQPTYSVLQRFSRLVDMRPRTAVLAFCVTMLGLIIVLDMTVSGERAASAGSNSTTTDGACQFMLAHSIDVGPENNLYGVVTLGANNTWAVGTYYAGGAELTLIEHWNGTAWDVVASPNPGTTQNIFTSVAAVSANDIWAVGYYIPDGGSTVQTLIEHWNGAAWTVVASPNPGPEDNNLQDVTAVSANDVWAVGESTYGTLIEHWNGSVWGIVASPNVGTESRLHGVEVVSATDIWAVGYSSEGTLIEH